MTDYEIYEVARQLLNTITNDLNESGVYSEIDGTLSLQWDTRPYVNAWAISMTDTDEPAQHIVGIHYELVKQVFNDIDSYCSYIESGFDDELLNEFFQSDDVIYDLIRTDWTGDEVRKNMFIGAITWVYFHEMTHLLQEHGKVRSMVDGSLDSFINEVNLDDVDNLNERSAAISHVTELAADYGATVWCIGELLRHYGTELNDNMQRNMQMFASGISCMFYRLYGENPSVPKDKAAGTHPHPLVRLETVLPLIYEVMAEINTPERKELVIRCNQAAVSVGVYWIRTCYGSYPSGESVFVQGTINREGGKDYLNEIINTWDELAPLILSNQRFDLPYHLLKFSDQYRSMVFDS